jgi:uncharacterized coiled-coil DUF342 family protein
MTTINELRSEIAQLKRNESLKRLSIKQLKEALERLVKHSRELLEELRESKQEGKPIKLGDLKEMSKLQKKIQTQNRKVMSASDDLQKIHKARAALEIKLVKLGRA